MFEGRFGLWLPYMEYLQHQHDNERDDGQQCQEPDAPAYPGSISAWFWRVRCLNRTAHPKQMVCIAMEHNGRCDGGDGPLMRLLEGARRTCLSPYRV